MHVPNRVTGRKGDYLASALSIDRRWRGGPALLIGNTNSGRIGLDEQVRTFDRLADGWIRDLDHADWADAFRALHGERRTANGQPTLGTRPTAATALASIRRS